VVAFEDQVLDPERRELRRAGLAVPVEPKVFDLLLYLVENRQRMVSKEDLIDAVWQGRIVSDSALTSAVNAARRALGDSGADQRLIRTVARKGFRFVGTIVDAPMISAGEKAPVAASPQRERPAVAVLPLTNMSGDPEQDYFADGITEDIITELSRWRWFPVIARHSTFAYKGRSIDIRQVGRELDARYVIEGSVRRAASRVRITVQLIDSVTGAHIWVERYDRQMDDIFALQDEIARRIAAVIEPELARSEQKLSAARPTTSLDAWDCLHRGLHMLYRFTEDDIAAARPLFERAIQLDPSFSRAHTSLAYTHQLDLLHGHTNERASSLALLTAHARRGVQLDESDSYGHIMMAYAHRWAGEIELALAAARRAVELNPNDAGAEASLGNAFDLMGQPHEARLHLERALRLNPRDPQAKFFHALMARTCLGDRDHAAAELSARKAIDMDPTQGRPRMFLVSALGHLGRAEEAREALRAWETVQPGFTRASMDLREYRNVADIDHIIDGLRKAGWKEKR
jgi:TolB-like protein/Tfp pilus assembly protein PilF